MNIILITPNKNEPLTEMDLTNNYSPPGLGEFSFIRILPNNKKIKVLGKGGWERAGVIILNNYRVNEVFWRHEN